MNGAIANDSIIDDLFRYNDWANQRVIKLASSLENEQLDAPFPMGFGSLRSTLFHILTAEKVWFERWSAVPWRKFPTDPEGTSVEQIASELADVARQRSELMNRERQSGWTRIVTYKDSKGNDYSNPLDDLLLHVANHGIYHRGQALHLLKRFGKTVPAGLDYIFFRIAQPTVAQSDETTQMMRTYGLEVNTQPGHGLAWDRQFIERYFAYQDWSNDRIVALAAKLGDAELDRDFAMGPGTLRKTLCHIFDGETWWYKNWTAGTSPFIHTAYAPADLATHWNELRKQRREFIASLDDESAHRVVTVVAGGPQVRAMIVESLVQLCGHATHHRSQLSNMLRQLGTPPPALDFLNWVREK